MGFRLRPKKAKVPREHRDLHAFCTTAARVLPEGHVVTMRDPGGECTLLLNGDVLHCEYHRGGRGVAIGAKQPPTYTNIANIMHAARLRFEEEASVATDHVGRA